MSGQLSGFDGQAASANGVDSHPYLRSGAACDSEVGCITCGDVGIPMRVLEIDAERELALCQDENDRRSKIQIALVQPVVVGAVLLVHAGTAIAKASDDRGPA
jgi:hydrogenase assembly chaperone HypC/HupF